MARTSNLQTIPEFPLGAPFGSYFCSNETSCRCPNLFVSLGLGELDAARVLGEPAPACTGTVTSHPSSSFICKMKGRWGEGETGDEMASQPLTFRDPVIFCVDNLQAACLRIIDHRIRNEGASLRGICILTAHSRRDTSRLI